MHIAKRGTCGTCIWKVDNKMTLTIKPMNGKSGVLCRDSKGGWPWWPYRNIKKVIVMKGVKTGRYAGRMFSGMMDCVEFDVSGLDVSAAEDMYGMFAWCSSLTDISALAEWDVSGVTDMSCMFECCGSLADVSPLKKWDVSGVVNMSRMFGGCEQLTDITSLSGWDTSNISDATGMFWGAVVRYDALDALIPMACPREGAFIGYKKCRNERIVQLEVPEDAKRSSACRRKCRCSKAKVLNVWTPYGKEAEYAVSNYKDSFIYRKGKFVEVINFDEDRFNECSTGIHFFMTRKEAEDYIL